MKIADRLRDMDARETPEFAEMLMHEAASALDAAERALSQVQLTIKAMGQIAYEDRIALYAPVDAALTKLKGE
jgi:hypothetical protein